jgi:mannosyltransferase
MRRLRLADSSPHHQPARGVTSTLRADWLPASWRSWRGASALLVVAVIASLAVSFYAIGAKSLSGDEAVTVQIATSPLRRFVGTILIEEPFSGLYYLLLRGWVALWGSGEAAVRSLSAVLVAGAIPPLFLVARWLASTRGGLIAILLAVSNAFLLRYAQNGRAYALAYLLVAVSTALVIHAVRRPSRGGWLTYAVVAALAAYAHFFAAFVVIAQLGWAIWASPSRRPVVLASGAIALVMLPLAFAIVGGPARGWIVDVSPESVLGVVFGLAGAGSAPPSRWLPVAYAIGLIIGVVSLGAARRDWRAPPAELMLAGCVAVPLIGSIAISIFKPILVSRYLIVVEPALIILVAVGFARARPLLLGMALAAVTVVLASSQALAWYAASTYPDLRRVAAQVLAGSQPDDAVLLFPPGSFKSLALDYYVQRLPTSGERPKVERLAGVQNPIGRVHGLGGRHHRVWLVLWGPIEEPTNPMRRWLAAFEAEFAVVGHNQVAGLDIYLFEAAGSGTGQP